MSREEEIILELKFEDRKYQLVKVDFNGVYSLEIRGSKKGSFYMGGGITINSYHFWNNLKILLNIINEINIKEISEKDIDKKLSFFIYKSKIITAEIKFFNERFFLRIKSYQNYRINRGEIVYYKNLEIKQSGSGYYIQEFDFPLNDQGKKEIKILIEEIENSIFQLLLIKLNDNSNEIKDYIKNEQLISDSKLLWINNNEYIENILFKPFFDLICDKLSERPLDINDLYRSLGLENEDKMNMMNIHSRYDFRFFERGFLLDRLRNGFNSINYLTTKLPNKCIEESSIFLKLFDKNSTEEWNMWRNVTFSSDEYSTNKLNNFNFMCYEISSYEDGLGKTIIPDINKIRSTVIKLFDLKRFYKDDTSKSLEIKTMIKRLILLCKEINYD